MALEPAGIELQAKGLSAYINNLDKIDKKQKAVFEVVAKDTGKTIDEVTKAAKKQKKALNDLAKAEKKAADEAKKLAAAQKTAATVSKAALVGVAIAAVMTVKQVATAAFELGKIGAQLEGQRTGLDNLAGSFGQSGSAISKAIAKASKGTVSDLQSINAANQALLLGVAKTPAEFEKLTSVALTLGRTVGLTSTQAIEQFTTALGRQSLLILDNFGISASQVNAEMERLAQVDFGRARSQLSEAEKSATFMKAALQVAGTAAATIGDEAGNAQAAFDRLTASSENFKTEIGLALNDLNQSLGVTEFLTKRIVSATESLQFTRGLSPAADIDKQIKTTEISISDLESAIERIQATQKGGIFGGFLGGDAETSARTIEKLEERLGQFQQKLDTLNLEKLAEDQGKARDAFANTPPVIEDNTKAIAAYENALKQALDLQLSFAREGEDAARKLARANEDVARKQERTVAKLEQRQTKDRDKLLKNQQKQLDRFENDRIKQISKAENEIRRERSQIAEQQKRDQKRLQNELQQARDRFNLSRLQSERRFNLSERRLRAEGDILGLKELREDFALTQTEEKENFNLSKKEQVKSGKEQQREQSKDLDNRLKTLQSDLEDRRVELLSSFDEQLRSQQEQQVEARANQQQAFAEAAQDREIALQREEEDRRISQRRQLEDLGRSFVEQKDITAQGVNNIAGEIERVFGLDGVANNIIVGFSERSRSEFTDLIENAEKSFKKLQGIEKKRKAPLVSLTGGGTLGTRLPTPASGPFDDGGVIPGPLGSPQVVQAHAGETILPTHKSFQAIAPVIPSQILRVEGGLDVQGSGFGENNEQVVQMTMAEMAEVFRVAVERVARRN